MLYAAVFKAAEHEGSVRCKKRATYAEKGGTLLA